MPTFLKSFLSIFVFSILLSSFVASNVSAADYSLSLFAKKAGYSTSGNKASLEGTVNIVVNVVLSLTGIIFLILAVYAGVRWMTAQGNSEDVTKAQETLQAAIIGMVVVSMAYAITGLIFNTLQKNIPTDNGVPDVQVSCTKDTDCKAGEKCNAYGFCYAPSCSDTVYQCGGNCSKKCEVGQQCVITADCNGGSCTAGKCAAVVNCSQFTNNIDCVSNSTCDWTVQVVGGAVGCYPKP